eukprot:Blabericola_migrator_1__3971@NODE_2200_length_3138_cov_6_089547_g1385_i0_p1_GENE_NODE_2200_length_3138_cov_6_089547_g1385_i0NODE_2200_length_3138_cov_6_089547_g1385_i0_p1_ORF_typecomplete_len339_score26_32LpqV/PF17301_2/4_7Podoplanin/PF05808_11/7_NODE_2200_length_3138_cov_6_089547_g1385_i01141130
MPDSEDITYLSQFNVTPTLRTCEEGAIPYERYVMVTGNRPPVLFNSTLGNPKFTCVRLKPLSVQPSCPYIDMRSWVFPLQNTWNLTFTEFVPGLYNLSTLTMDEFLGLNKTKSTNETNTNETSTTTPVPETTSPPKVTTDVNSTAETSDDGLTEDHQSREADEGDPASPGSNTRRLSHIVPLEALLADLRREDAGERAPLMRKLHGTRANFDANAEALKLFREYRHRMEYSDLREPQDYIGIMSPRPRQLEHLGNLWSLWLERRLYVPVCVQYELRKPYLWIDQNRSVSVRRGTYLSPPRSPSVVLEPRSCLLTGARTKLDLRIHPWRCQSALDAFRP